VKSVGNQETVLIESVDERRAQRIRDAVVSRSDREKWPTGILRREMVCWRERDGLMSRL